MVHSSSAVDTIHSPTSVLDTILPDTLTAPLHYGDLAKQGLAGWNPVGIFQWFLELIQVTTGLPWAYTIITGIIVWRLLLILLTVVILQKTGRVAGRYANSIVHIA
jgi:YidC/Oxa1 family membrane protein insertase